MTEPITVAALFVATNGAYFDLPGVDPWDEKRDATLYDGPYPVVAHPPCTRWCRLAGLVEARWGHKRGEDGGLFASALASVRRWGGVLEHPAYSDAWSAHGLAKPPSSGGWVAADFQGGWTCHVEQGRYGHPARKATWLYAHGVDLPSLRWGVTARWDGPMVGGVWPHGKPGCALVSFCGNHSAPDDMRPRLRMAAAKATPPEFRDQLLAIARARRGDA